MNPFKVGDRVRVTRHVETDTGKTGTVISIETETITVLRGIVVNVQYDDGSRNGWFDNEYMDVSWHLELAP